MNTSKITWEQAVSTFRDNPKNTEAVLACYYDDPLIAAAERYRHSAEFVELTHYLPSNKGKLLDLGAGRGISSYAFAKYGWDVVALEPDPSKIVGGGAILELSQETNANITIVENWGERLPFEDESFDIVHGRAVLHHAQDLKAFCREAARVLKPGGKLIAIREHVISKTPDLDIFLAEHPLHSLYGGENAFTLSEYRSAIESAKLTIEKELNPWESEINLHPETFNSFRKKLGKKLHIPFGLPIPNKLLGYLGNRYSKPGRLYSFIAQKRITK